MGGGVTGWTGSERRRRVRGAGLHHPIPEQRKYRPTGVRVDPGGAAGAPLEPRASPAGSCDSSVLLKGRDGGVMEE